MKRFKCVACKRVRQERYMTIENMRTTKTGKEIISYQCGDCEEENRGKYKRNNK